MVYEGKTLDRGSRTRVMDAFVVLNKEEYKKLTGYTPIISDTPKTEGYQGYIPTEDDYTKLSTLKTLIDNIYQYHGKSKYKNQLIKLFRGMVTPELTLDKKWLYNQVLIDLFTIDSFQ